MTSLAALLAVPHELVALQGRGYAKGGLVRVLPEPLGSQDLAYAPEVDRLWSVMVQTDHIFDGTSQIRFARCGE
jgi:hypothetical protein